jgi:hypothetical protein
VIGPAIGPVIGSVIASARNFWRRSAEGRFSPAGTENVVINSSPQSFVELAERYCSSEDRPSS